jgi:hypothetical protein
MRLQGSQTRLGGDISRVKRESAGNGRKRKSVGKQAVAEKGEYVRRASCVVRAPLSCERAAPVWSRRRRRETSGGREAQSLTACPCWRRRALTLRDVVVVE